MPSSPVKNAVILMNLGTPEAANVSAVRRFLREFLSDQRVVELPRLLWWPILYGVILPFRPRKALEAYESVWTPGGSPLKVITLEQQAKLQARISTLEPGLDVKVLIAMTYGEPNLKRTIQMLQAEGTDRIIILPLYPQFSATTTAPVYDQVSQLQMASRDIPEIFINRCYYDRDDYVEALASSVSEHWAAHGRLQKLLFSFHGIPQRCVDKGDPYYAHCKSTAERVAQRLSLGDDEWAFSFQSRLGKAKWLQPYTDKWLEHWASNGVESVDVICPAFSADCIETLEEIQQENQELFLEHGGKQFGYIPCLNSRDDHIELMANIVSPLLKRSSY
jgi:protoporphyrin/coproporphyrin ferrochelatase